jgi:hypothetical protein
MGIIVEVMIVLALVCLVFLVYFLPSIVGSSRQHHQQLAIVMLNLFLGWTFLGWVAALVWACTATRREG